MTKEIVDEWVEYMTPIYAPRTVYFYHLNLNAGLRIMDAYGKPFSFITHNLLSAWVNTGKFKSRNMRIHCSRSFFNYCRELGYTNANPANLVRVRLREMTVEERTRKETIPFTHEEYERLAAYPKLTPFWRAATVICYWTGLRIRDVACLEWASIREKSLLVYQQKTGDKVEHFFCNAAVNDGDLLHALLELKRNKTPYCFPEECALAKDAANCQHLYAQIKPALKKLGLGHKRFHGLRHSCALRLEEMGVPKEGIAAHLGHRRVAMTEHYLDHEKRLTTPEECDCI